MTTAPHFRLFARTEQAALLDLPWALPLEDWPEDRVVDIERGIGRHVVRFVELNGAYFALKELPPRIAAREYRLLAELERKGVPSVEVVGVADDRTSAEGQELQAVLITRYLEFALPYRLILSRATLPATEPSIRNALSELLVRLHIAGFFWGDCSLSNALFRRDAGALSAYLVDAETSELHERLSDGQRQHDLDIAEENLAGELHDLAAELGRDVVDDPFEFAASVRASYDELWDELTREEVFTIGEGPPARGAAAPAERARVRRRGGRARLGTETRCACCCIRRSSSPATTGGGCCASPDSTHRRIRRAVSSTT